MDTKLYEQGYAMIEAIFNRDNKAFEVASRQFLGEKAKAILATMIEGDEMDDDIDVDPDADLEANPDRRPSDELDDDVDPEADPEGEDEGEAKIKPSMDDEDCEM